MFFAPEDVYEAWKVGNLGIYRNVYFIKGSSLHPTIKLHGAGGGLMRRLYSISPESYTESLVRKNSANQRFGDDIREMVSGFFRDYGAWLGTPLSADDHYLFQRNRLHFGRSSYRGIGNNILTPLCDAHLLPIRHTGYENKNTFAIDVFAATCPELGVMAYDKPSKEISWNDISESPLSTLCGVCDLVERDAFEVIKSSKGRYSEGQVAQRRSIVKPEDLLLDEANEILGNSRKLQRLKDVYMPTALAAAEDELAAKNERSLMSAATIVFMAYFQNDISNR